MSPSSQPPVREIRGHRVILDDDLASLYEVTTRRLLEQVRRHPLRFPPEYCFSLSLEEVAFLKAALKGQDMGAAIPRVTSSGRVPVAFTADGAVMAASVLHSPPAIATNLLVARFHNRALELLGESPLSTARLASLERSLSRSNPALAMVWKVLSGLRESSALSASTPKGK